MHEVNQAPGFDGVTAICNSCGCSCYALRITEMFRAPGVARLPGRVDGTSAWPAAGAFENCQTNAVRLGQKLCISDPHVSDAYQSDLEIPWDKKSYHTDYRTDRTDVMDSGTAPCKAQCPAHVPVQGYIKLASQGRYTEALELIKTENPFPAVCGRICGKRREDACTRSAEPDAPIAIDDIKKFIAEKDLDADHPLRSQNGEPAGQTLSRKDRRYQRRPCGPDLRVLPGGEGLPPVTVYEGADPGRYAHPGHPSFRLERT